MAAGAVVGLPLAVLQPPVDRDEPALGQLAGCGFAAAAERADVDVADLFGAAAAHAVDGEAQPADRLAAGQCPQLGVLGEATDHVDYLESVVKGHVVLVGVRERWFGVGGPAAAAAGPPARCSEGDLLFLGGLLAVGVGLVGAAAEADAADDLVLAALGAVVGFPLAVDEPAGDGDRAAFARYLAQASALGPKLATSM